jgi:small conductance mechanosensitive channel
MAATDGLVAACGPTAQASRVCEAVFQVTHNTFLAQSSETLIVTPARVLLILAIAFICTRIARRMIRRMVRGLQGLRPHANTLVHLDGISDPVISARRAQRARTIGSLLDSVATFVIWIIAVLMVLGELHINIGPLIAGAGIVGIAFGFGAQNLVRDFLSGIFMLIEDQYGVGDIIDAGPATGTVENISLRTTRLRDVNGVVWHIPNGQMSRIGNKSQQWSRALIDVDVAYDTDIDRASEVIKQVADGLMSDEEFAAMILEEPEVWGVERLGADGVSIRLVVKTTPADQFKVARQLRARIKAAFDEVGIEIPFPQRVVWHRENGAAVKTGG